MWGIENRFLLIDLNKGLKESQSYLSEISNSNKSSLVNVFSHFYSIKAEKELSVNRYDVSLLKFLFPAIQKGWEADIEYHRFKLSPLSQNKYENLPTILAYENYNSIIDKYVSLIRVLHLLLTSNEKKEHKNFLSSRLIYLLKKIDNSEIKNLISIIDPLNIQISPDDEKCILILDLYTKGEYEKCQKECIPSAKYIFQCFKFVFTFAVKKLW